MSDNINLDSYVVDRNVSTGVVHYKIPANAEINPTGVALDVLAPPNINDTTAIAGYADGQSNASWYGDGIARGNVDTIMSNGTQSIVVNLDKSAPNLAEKNCEILKSISNIFGGDINNVNLYGASNGSDTVVKIAADASDIDGITIRNVMPVDYAYASSTSEEYMKKLAQSGTNLILATDNVRDEIGCRYYGETMSKYGGNALIIEYDRPMDHPFKLNYFIDDNALDWMANKTDFGNGTRGFSVYKFDNGVQQEVVLTDDEIKALLKTTGSYGSNYKINLSYDDLSKLNSGGSLSVVASNVVNVIDGINEICDGMNKSTALLSPSSQSFESTTSIPGSISSAQNVYLGMSSDLLSSLNKELDLIQSIAQTYYDMDNSLASSASSLSGGVSSNINSQLLSIANSDITSSITFNKSFYFDMLSTGKSGKVVKSELEALVSGGSLSGVLHENFESERKSANDIKTAISNFTSNIGSSLQGEAWNKVKEKLFEYNSLMDKRIDSAEKLELAITEAINLILQYMEDYDELDDTKFQELKDEIELIKRNINKCEEIYNATHEVKTKDDKGKEKKYTEYTYSVDARNQAKKYIQEANEKLELINKELVKLEGLSEIINQAQDIINQALNEIYSSYGVDVSKIVTGNSSSFIPPTYTVYEPKELPTYTSTESNTIKKPGFDLNWIFNGHKYENYEDYENGVKKEYNPMYNDKIKDNGISFDFDKNFDLENFEDENAIRKDLTTDALREEKIAINKSKTSASSNSINTNANTSSNNSVPSNNGSTSNNSSNTNGSISNQNYNNSPSKSNNVGSSPTPNTKGNNTIQSKPNDTIVNDKDTSNKTDKIIEEDTVKEQNKTESNNTIKQVEPIKTMSNSNTSNSRPSNVVSSNSNSNINTNTKKDNVIVENKEPIVESNSPIVEEKPIIIENKDDIVKNEPSIETDTTIENEPIIETKPNIDIENTIDSNTQTGNDTRIDNIPVTQETPIIKDIPNNEVKLESHGNTAKTIGALAGVGAAVGATAYAAHSYMKSKGSFEQENAYEDDDEYNDENYNDEIINPVGV